MGGAHEFGELLRLGGSTPKGTEVAGSIVGLDLGSLGLRGVQVRNTKKGTVIEKVGVLPFDPGIIKNGEVAEPEALIEALTALWKQSKFSTKKVVIGLSNSGVITRQIDLPWMQPKDFKDSLKFQIGDALPVDVEGVRLDYHPLGEFRETDEHGSVTDMLRILLVAANMEIVETYSDALLDAGLQPIKADTVPFGLIRLARQGIPGSPEDPVEAIVDLGADVLNIIVHQGGQPRFVRTIGNYGGNIVTNAIKERFGISFTEAEEIKRRTGLAGPAPQVAAVVESSVFGGLDERAAVVQVDPMSQAALAVVNPWSAALVAEVRNSLDYFLSAYPNVHLADVRVVGGGVYLDGLVSRLNAELRVPVTPLDPFEVVEVKSNSIIEEYGPISTTLAAAVGVAMGVQA